MVDVSGSPFTPRENAMLRILLPCSAVLAACSPSPQDTAMRSAITPTSVPLGAAEAMPDPVTGQATGQAAQGPMPEPVSAAENPAPPPLGDTPAEASGRRTLSTAFVRVEPNGHLTVELNDGRVLVLRNVAMRATTYCGEQVLGGPAGKQFCGGYADVAAARPGGVPAPSDPLSIAPKPAISNHNLSERR
jgi:hypothetical protein